MKKKQRVLSAGLCGVSFIPREGSDDGEAPWQADERRACEDSANAREADMARKRRPTASRSRIWIGGGATAALALTSVFLALLLRH
jgi:hypothetical protein